MHEFVHWWVPSAWPVIEAYCGAGLLGEGPQEVGRLVGGPAGWGEGLGEVGCGRAVITMGAALAMSVWPVCIIDWSFLPFHSFGHNCHTDPLSLSW